MSGTKELTERAMKKARELWDEVLEEFDDEFALSLIVSHFNRQYTKFHLNTSRHMLARDQCHQKKIS
jgi:hypothetical protein